jgi:hypothetical protein
MLLSGEREKGHFEVSQTSLSSEEGIFPESNLLESYLSLVYLGDGKCLTLTLVSHSIPLKGRRDKNNQEVLVKFIVDSAGA